MKVLQPFLPLPATPTSFWPIGVEIMYLSAKEKSQVNKNYKEEVKNTLAKELKLAVAKRERLLDGYCNGIISKEAYKQKESVLRKEETDLKVQLAGIDEKIQKKKDTLEQTKKVFLKACYAKKEFLQAEKEKKRKALQTLLWNATIENQELASVSFKPVFQIIANEPNLDDFNNLRRGRDSNPGNPQRFNILAGCCFQPLSHLSIRTILHTFHNFSNILMTIL